MMEVKLQDATLHYFFHVVLFFFIPKAEIKV